jgi:hypothetical protein
MNPDWSVDTLDVRTFLSKGRFDTGLPATWSEGDFGYDGVVDIPDIADFVSSGLFKRIGRPMALRQASAEQRGSRGATAGTGLAGCDARFEVPRGFLSTLKAGFFSLAQTGLETALLAGRPHRGMECRQRLWMSIAGSSSGDA